MRNEYPEVTMGLTHAEAVEAASEYARRAAAALEGDSGSGDDPRALALVSIAHSLALIAEHSRQF
jgi:hypothetical protein